jgi:hypothetical protein
MTASEERAVAVRARRLLLAWVIGSVVSQAHAGAPMVTPSTFSVTPQGAAAYEVPIRVAPGIAGVEPKLSFAYNSQGSNGIMGMGWSLTGLSMITRCPRTIAQDGVHGTVDFSANDRFCLDGKRLKLFNPSNNPALPYWSAPAAGGYVEYRTEIASFSRIRAYGTAGLSGPAWFQVYMKSGEIIEYGNTADSQITGSGHFTPLMWAVNKVSDRYSNYMTFSYKQTPGYVEFYPTAINYTGNTNASQGPNQQVVFNYENRPGTDIIRGYGPTGIPVLTGQQLASVQVVAGTLLVRQYNLTYTTSSVSGRSTLQSLNECSPATPTVYNPGLVQGGLCRPLLSFTWPNGTGMLTPDGPNNAGSVGGWAPTRVSDYVADINGDGKGDLIRLWFDGTTTDPAYAQVTLSTGSSFTVASNNTVGPWGVLYTQSGSGCPPISGCSVVNGFVNLFGDVNGDGKADLVRINNTTTQYNAQLMLSNGTGFNGATYNGLISSYVFADALPTYYDSPQGGGIGYSYQQTSIPFVPLLQDISGDGRADLVLVGMAGGGSSVLVTALSTGSTFAAPTTSGTGAASTPEPGEMVVLGGDVDGDGKADAIQLFSQCQDVTNTIGGQIIGATCPTRIARVLISNGSTLVAATDVKVGAGGDGNPADTGNYFTELMADVNGDGKMDLIRIRNNNPGATTGTAVADVWLSTGNPQAPLVLAGSYSVGPYGIGTTEFLPIDVNGDGRTDLVAITNSNGQASAAVYLSQGYGYASTPDITWTSIGAWDPANIEDLPMDVNGDGRIDLVRLTNSNNTAVANILTQQGTPFDVITGFSNGLSSSINLNYQTISEVGVPHRAVRMQAYHMPVPTAPATLTIPNVYTKGTSSVYPMLDFQGPMKVVAFVETDNGIGGVNNVSYSYADGVIDLSGRGFLGFGQVQQQDNTANIITTTNYDQTFPYIGMISSKQTTAPLQTTLPAPYLLGTTNNTPGQVADDNGSPYPFIQTSVDQAYGLTTGHALPSVTTSTVYDMWGNASKVTVTTSDPANGNDNFTTVTNNTYKAADTTNWILGRLSQSQVTNTVSATPVVSPPSLATFSVGIGAQSGGGSNSLGVITATATVTSAGGVAPVVYSWSGGGNGVTASQAGAQVTFSGNFTQYGVFSISFTLTARDAAGRVATVPYTVILSNAVSIVPASTNWGTVGAASDSGDWFTVKNNSASSSILITAHAPVSGPAGVWSWQGQAGYCQPGITVLAGGASCVSFFGMGGVSTPGAYTAADQLSYVAQGTTAPTFAVQQPYSFSVATTTANVTSLTFGNQALNTTSAPQNFIVTNSASNGGPMYITGISMVGAQPANFPMSHNCGASIAAGASCTVTVQFQPTWIANGFSASVQIQGGYDRMQAGVDSGYRPTATGVNFAIPVSGNGIGTIATLTGFTKNYGADYSSGTTIHIDSWWSWATATSQVNFRNDGNVPMTLSGISFPNGGSLSTQSTTCTNVAPGASCAVVVQETSGTMGNWSGTWSTVGATSNASGPYTNIVYATISHWSTSSATFGVTRPASQAQTLTLYNMGNGTANWSGALANLPAGYSANMSACSSVAGSGGSCTVSITFAPSAAGGCPTYCATNVSPTDTGMTGYAQDVLSVSGTAVNPPASLFASVTWSIISPNGVTWTVQNTNALPQTITGISENGSGNVSVPRLSTSSTCKVGNALNPGATCTVIYTAASDCPGYSYQPIISNAAGSTYGPWIGVAQTSPHCIPK